MEKRFIKIGRAAELLGINRDSKCGKRQELLPDRKAKGETRFYDSAKLLSLGDSDCLLLCESEQS